jgi:hypothetical protein
MNHYNFLKIEFGYTHLCRILDGIRNLRKNRMRYQYDIRTKQIIELIIEDQLDFVTFIK